MGSGGFWGPRASSFLLLFSLRSTSVADSAFFPAEVLTEICFSLQIPTSESVWSAASELGERARHRQKFQPNGVKTFGLSGLIVHRDLFRRVGFPASASESRRLDRLPPEPSLSSCISSDFVIPSQVFLWFSGVRSPFGEVSRSCCQVRNRNLRTCEATKRALKNETGAKQEAENLMPGKGGGTFPGSQRRGKDKKKRIKPLSAFINGYLSPQHIDPGACWETSVPLHRTL